MKNTSRPEYTSWKKMKERCSNPNHSYYHNYGGRGISVCADWAVNFAAFLKDMGERPENAELDRIDPDLGYFPENCRWVSRKDNCQNRKTSKRWFVNGKSYNSAYDAAQDIGVGSTTVERWCDGYRDYKTGVYRKPRSGCYSVPAHAK